MSGCRRCCRRACRLCCWCIALAALVALVLCRKLVGCVLDEYVEHRADVADLRARNLSTPFGAAGAPGWERGAYARAVAASAASLPSLPSGSSSAGGGGAAGWYAREFVAQRPRGALPVVYSESYNLRLCGLEDLHHFDTAKYGRVLGLLRGAGALLGGSGGGGGGGGGGAAAAAAAAAAAGTAAAAAAPAVISPRPATTRHLRLVHTSAYLDSISSSAFELAVATEFPPLLLLPAWLRNRRV